VEVRKRKGSAKKNTLTEQRRLIEKVKVTVARYNMLKKGDSVLVAVSGGPDSVCLLEVLSCLKEDYSLSLHVAHLNHRFRKEAKKEAEFVRLLAEKKGIPAAIEAIDVKAYCRERGLSLQEGAREVRYSFLNRVADAVGAVKIATGHTADDQAETFLMRLLRGAGAAGLSGIPPVRERIIRPLIDVTKKEAFSFLKEKNIKYVKDPSNVKPKYLRNKIRLELIPLLKKYNPNIIDTLHREAELLREDDALLDEITETCFKGIVTDQKKDSITLDYSKFNGLLPALKKRALRRAAAELTGSLRRISYHHIVSGIDVIDRTGKGIDLPHNIRIERDYNYLKVFAVKEGAEAVKDTVGLKVPGITDVPDFNIRIETIIRDRSAQVQVEVGKADKNTAFFDYDKIALPLFIRRRLEGDYFYPAGMKGRKKLKEFFIDKKIPREERKKLPVLTTKNNDILWIVGLRMDERFRAREDTVRELIVRVI
jgi:tRNA(Ile)-lysidine synthase